MNQTKFEGGFADTTTQLNKLLFEGAGQKKSQPNSDCSQSAVIGYAYSGGCWLSEYSSCQGIKWMEESVDFSCCMASLALGALLHLVHTWCSVVLGLKDTYYGRKMWGR